VVWRWIGLAGQGAEEKKRRMLRFFGGITEIVVCADEKTVY
jgi:hypothetical protein